VKQGLSLGFAQSLTLTPQLQQSIRLLQLSSIELELEIEQQLVLNPFLERDDGASPAELFDHQPANDESLGSETAEDLSWEGDGSLEIAPNDAEWGVEAGGAGDDLDPFLGLSTPQDLTAHLKRQALHLRLSPLDAASLDFLIESLDERGFLVEPLAELAASLTSDAQDLERATEQLRIAHQCLQRLEPTGIGAANTIECLRLQALRVSDEPLRAAMLALLEQPLSVLARRNSKQLSTAIGCEESLVQKGLRSISELEPQPSRSFVPTNNSVVIPDVFVHAVTRQRKVSFTAVLNTDLMPRLKVDDITARLLQLHKARATKNKEQSNAMQQALMEAKGFIKAITQRFDTVLRVAQAIVARQGQFLQHGAVAMRPLVLRDIADELGLHESTVSRVTTSKYMATPQGTFEFKYFFDASLSTGSGGETSGTAVRAFIAQLIAAENKSKPLSDGKLADVLAKQGIECARRTVAKYREAMRIPTASLRKA